MKMLKSLKADLYIRNRPICVEVMHVGEYFISVLCSRGNVSASPL